MFTVFCRRLIPRGPPIYYTSVAQQFGATKNAVLVRSCSSSVCENVSQKESFTVSSYLIYTCGLSSDDAVSASKKLLGIKSPEKPNAVLKLLREYGFTDAHIHSIITRLPKVLLARCPNKTLLPKLQFLHSIGVPLPVLAQNLSKHPFVLTRSLENSIIPLYNYLKSILGLDERVVHVFIRSPKVFGRGWSKGIASSISFLRERGVPQSTIVSLVMDNQPSLGFSKEKLAVLIDRAVEMGFDVTGSGFAHAMKVLLGMSESTLKHKMEVYRICGWSESETSAAFLRFPYCLKFSEKKITANMDFLVNELGCNPLDVARRPVVLGLSLDNRTKPRCLVARVLNDKGLKNVGSVFSLLLLSEKKFLESYIFKYEKDVPELLDIYSRKVEVERCGMDFGRV